MSACADGRATAPALGRDGSAVHNQSCHSVMIDCATPSADREPDTVCFLLPQPCWTTSRWWATASGSPARRWSPTCRRVRIQFEDIRTMHGALLRLLL
jgi:hypothetical protein